MTISETLLNDSIPAYELFQQQVDLLMASIVFYEKTLADWIDHLAIEVPRDANLEDIRSLYVKVARQMQQVSYFLSLCSTYNTTLSAQSDMSRAKFITNLVNSYSDKNARRPAAAVLEQMADKSLEDTNFQLAISKTLRDFWKERRDTLVEVRKCLEQIMMTHLAEMKYLPTN